MHRLPDDFTQRIRNLLSPSEAEAFIHALGLPSPVSIRINNRKNAAIPTGEQIPWCKTGYYLDQRPAFTLDPLFHAGLYYVQEAGSMLIEYLLAPHLEQLTSATVLDACAAPGGKSTHLLSLLDKNSVLVSNEIIPNRNKTLRYNLAKWGSANKIITQSEPDRLAGTQARFDLIVVDAPCSGEGLFRKDPDAITEWSAERTLQCEQRQENILKTLYPLLKEGGLLLYSTCTYNPGENDQQIDTLLRTGQFEVLTGVPPSGIEATKFGWQAYPHNVKSEGFYCSLLLYTGTTRPKGKIKSSAPEKTKDITGIAGKWLENGTGMDLYTQNTFLHFAHPQTVEMVQQLTGAYIRDFGIHADELKGKDFIPSYALALSTDVSKQIPSIQLTKTEALEFLRCGPIQTVAEQQGWHLVAYQEAALGWAKKISQRWNNYHPKEYRILMDIDSIKE